MNPMSGYNRPRIYWHDYFTILPRKTISDRWIWGKCQRRMIEFAGAGGMLEGPIYSPEFVKDQKEFFEYKLKTGRA